MKKFWLLASFTILAVFSLIFLISFQYTIAAMVFVGSYLAFVPLEMTRVYKIKN